MKHIFTFATFIVLLIYITGCSKAKTILVTPENSLDWLSVYQITLEDTATIIKGNVYGEKGSTVTIPSSVCLRGGKSGTEYQLLSSGNTPKEQTITIPENMTMPFSLMFEPIDENEPFVDLILHGNEMVKGINTAPEKTKYTTHIKGTLPGRPNTTRLLLIPAGEDFRVNPYISIPVSEGKFAYDLHTDIATAYELVCWDEIINGAWYNAELFSDGGTVEFLFHPVEEEKAPEAVVATSKMNKEYQAYRKDVIKRFHEEEMQAWADSLYANDLFYTKEYKQMVDSASKVGWTQEFTEKRAAMIQSKEALTEAGKAFKTMSDSLYRAKKEYVAEYNRKKPGIVGFYLIFEMYYWEKDSQVKATYQNVFETLYRDKYAGHPFTKKMLDMITAENIRPGEKFIDFTIPDIDGNMHTLSEEIKGKIAVIDLWASWCGPCRKHSREIIPIYNEYKDKGFTVVGIARENENTNAMKAAIAKDGYQWLNLVELNDAQNIWQKYGVGNGGGKTFLVAADGSIVAIAPSADDIKKYIEEHIGKN